MNLDYKGKFVVIDLEFNNASEIIEMDAKKIFLDANDTTVEGDLFKRIIRTEKKPSKELMELTGISLDDWKNGCTFADAWEDFKHWIDDGMESLFIAWGNRDRVILQNSCQDIGMRHDMDDMFFIDLQAYIMEKNDIKYLPSLTAICEKEFGHFAGSAHNCADDVNNTANILKNYL